MNAAQWASWLRDWSAKMLGSEAARFSYPGATEAELARAEERLGVHLPPSYRSFLQASNGYILPVHGPLPPRLWSAREIEWLRVTDPDLVEIWSSDAQLGPAIASTLRISDAERGGTAIYVLNPLDVVNGEWEAWFHAHWIPGAERFGSFEKLMREERANDYDALSESDAAALFESAASYDEAAQKRERAARAMGRGGSADDYTQLNVFLRDDVASVRAAAADGLGRLRDARAVEPLIAALDDDDPNVAYAAVTALNVFRDARAAPVLGKLLASGTTSDIGVALALKDLGAPGLEQLLARTFVERPQTRSALATTFGTMGDADERIDRALDALLRDRDESVRRSAAAAIKQRAQRANRA